MEDPGCISYNRTLLTPSFDTLEGVELRIVAVVSWERWESVQLFKPLSTKHDIGLHTYRKNWIMYTSYEREIFLMEKLSLLVERVCSYLKRCSIL